MNVNTMRSLEFAEAMYDADVSYAPKDPHAYQLQYADHMADAALTFLRKCADDDEILAKICKTERGGVAPRTAVRSVIRAFLDAIEDTP